MSARSRTAGAPAGAPTDAPADASAGAPQVIVGSDGRAKVYRPLPEDARRAAREAGIRAYGEGRFFEAHELMEPAWMGSPDPAERDLDQGLIKLAAAYVHAGRGNALGMRKNLLGAQRRLAAVVHGHGGTGAQAARRARVDAGETLRLVEDRLASLEALAARRRLGGEQTQAEDDLLELIRPPEIPRG